MDEEILREAAMKQHPKDQAAGVSKAQGINLNQVNRLSLECRSKNNPIIDNVYTTVCWI